MDKLSCNWFSRNVACRWPSPRSVFNANSGQMAVCEEFSGTAAASVQMSILHELCTAFVSR